MRPCLAKVANRFGEGVSFRGAAAGEGLGEEIEDDRSLAQLLGKIEAELPYWLGVETSDLPPLPLDGSGGVNGHAGAGIVAVELSPAELQELNALA